MSDEQTNTTSAESQEQYRGETARDCRAAIDSISAQREALSAIRGLVAMCLQDPMDQEWIRQRASDAAVGVVQIEGALEYIASTLTDAGGQLERAGI